MDSQTKTKNTFFTCLFGIEPMLKKTPALGELPTTAKAWMKRKDRISVWMVSETKMCSSGRECHLILHSQKI